MSAKNCLNRLITDNQQYLPYFQNEFSNHYPMVLWSIKQMGGREHDIAFQGSSGRWQTSLQEYQISFQQTPPHTTTITDSNWRDHLGKLASYPDFLQFFSDINFYHQPQRLEFFLCELGNKPDTTLFHALIRFSMGVQSNNLREQQISLAYWAANFTPAAELPSGDEDIKSIMTRVIRYFAETVDFIALHIITSYAAVLSLPKNLRYILEAPFTSTAKHYAKAWQPAGSPPDNNPLDQALYQNACLQAFTSLDDHYIKIVYALKQIHDIELLPGINAALASALEDHQR